MPDSYRISELPAVSSLNNGDLVEVSQVDALSASGYTSKKSPMTELGNKINNSIEYATALDTTDKTVIGAINEVNSALYLPDTATGTIATFTTSLAKPLVSCECELPYDANGYSNLKIGYCDFNQLVQNGNFADTSNWNKNSTASWSVDDNILTFNLNADSSNNRIYQPINIQSGNKYLIITDIYTNVSSSGYFGVFNSFSSSSNTHTFTPIKQTLSTIVQGTNETYIVIGLSGRPVDTLIFYISNVLIFDLTQMFGSTIADLIYTLEQNTSGAGVSLFKKIFYKDYYAYTVGGSLVTIASVNSDNNPNASIDFGTTIYGGSLDVTNGKLTDSYNADGTSKTPVIIDVTPTAINTAIGTDNIFTTAQGNNSITYLETIKEYIDKMVNP